MNEYIETLKLGDMDAAAKWLNAHPELLTARDPKGPPSWLSLAIAGSRR